MSNDLVQLFLSRLKAFGVDRSGATAIEYALIASGVTLAIVSAVTLMGTSLTTTFDAVALGFAGGGGGDS